LRKSEALLLMNMLAAEFGYTAKWIMVPGEKRASAVRLINDEGDYREFSGDEKLEQAVKWLREKA
jgi:hypothetical protein